MEHSDDPDSLDGDRSEKASEEALTQARKEEEMKHESPEPSVSDEDMESWPDVDEGYEGDKEDGGISKEMMWKM